MHHAKPAIVWVTGVFSHHCATTHTIMSHRSVTRKLHMLKGHFLELKPEPHISTPTPMQQHLATLAAIQLTFATLKSVRMPLPPRTSRPSATTSRPRSVFQDFTRLACSWDMLPASYSLLSCSAIRNMACTSREMELSVERAAALQTIKDWRLKGQHSGFAHSMVQNRDNTGGMAEKTARETQETHRRHIGDTQE